MITLLNINQYQFTQHDEKQCTHFLRVTNITVPDAHILVFVFLILPALSSYKTVFLPVHLFSRKSSLTVLCPIKLFQQE